MIKNFSQFVAETADKEVFFAFGRFNPPTAGHEKLLEKMSLLAKGNPYRVYVSHTEGTSSSPLPYAEKIKWMRKLFPKHARSIILDEADSLQAVCTRLHEQGFTKITMVTSTDRIVEQTTILENYNGQTLKENFYNFKTISVVSGADSDPDAEVKMRTAASSNDLDAFSRGLPSLFRESEDLFNAVRNGLGLKATKNFRKHIQLETVSDRREKYVAGELFEIGDEVVIKESQEVAKIVNCGSNYLVIETQQGQKLRKWLDAVELLEKKTSSEKLDPTPLPVAKPIVPRTPSLSGISISKLRSFKQQ